MFVLSSGETAQWAWGSEAQSSFSVQGYMVVVFCREREHQLSCSYSFLRNTSSFQGLRFNRKKTSHVSLNIMNFTSSFLLQIEWGLYFTYRHVRNYFPCVLQISCLHTKIQHLSVSLSLASLVSWTIQMNPYLSLIHPVWSFLPKSPLCPG